MSEPTATPPTLDALREARTALADDVIVSPMLPLPPGHLQRRLPTTRIELKLEALQPTGSFKPRAAVLWARSLPAEARRKGLVAVSAGNHAMAVAYAAQRTETTAKVVMPQTADPMRVDGARKLGAEVVLTPDVHAAFAEVERIVQTEGRTFVHPFEGPKVALGVGTIGLEIVEQCPDVDAVVVPIGGGGLCAGIAASVKQLRPNTEIFGVEPDGADSMHRSVAAGTPQAIEAVKTIADSLGAPHAAPYSFALCRDHVDAFVTVSDDDMQRAMAVLMADTCLAVEPAGAAATAAAWGPLAPRLQDKTVVLVVCGGNVALELFAQYVARGQSLLAATP
ncbi:MAG: threonine/serine dehydratase [Myxococcota bacterium]